MSYRKLSSRFRKRQPMPLVAALFAAATASLVVCTADAQAPYDLDKFKPVLDDSKLQAPTSSPAMINQGDFEGASNAYFFLDPTCQYMTFTVTGDSNRSELRQLTGDWDTATTTPQRMVARVRVLVPEDESLKQFTFLQIHDKKNGNEGLNKPLLRVVLRSDYRGKKNHLWAAIRTPKDFNKPISINNLATEHIDLGPRPKDFFDAEVIVHHSQMKVLINGSVKVDMDVSYWDGLANYFKAGVYNQDPGTSKVEFDSLQFFDSYAAPEPPAAAEPVVEEEPE